MEVGGGPACGGDPPPARTVQGPYLRPVAEHLPVSSVGHELLGKLWRMRGRLRWGCGQGGPQLGRVQGSWPPAKWLMALGGGVGGWGGDPVRAQQSVHILGPSCPQANSQVPLKAVLSRIGCCRMLWRTRTPGQARVARPAWTSRATGLLCQQPLCLEPQPTGQALGMTPTAGFKDLVGKERYKIS